MVLKRCCYRIIFTAFTLLIGAALAWAIDDGFSSAKNADGKYTAVYYSADTNTADLMQNLNIGFSDKVLAGMHLKGARSAEDELATLLDSLYIQVSDILDMHLYSLKINIKVCRGAEELKDIYKKMFAEDLKNQRSFYVYDTNTIYVSGDSFKREIVGHEIGHAVISHYFVVPPSIKIQEVLAMYVEYNLRRPEK